MILDIHVHSDRSDGLDTPNEMVRYAAAHHIDALVFTDHNRLFPTRLANTLSRTYGVLVIPGVEIGSTFNQQHMLLLNVEHADRHSLSELDFYSLAEAAKRDGGIAVAAHPSRGIKRYYELGVDAVETINGADMILSPNPHRLPELGGSDAHRKEDIGRACTLISSELPPIEVATDQQLKIVRNSIIQEIKKYNCAPIIR
jgi:predicted metal-dependent phosphoesterase TrpH